MKKQRTKYGSVEVNVDGIRFQSKKEANRYWELKLLERAKVIKNLRLQPKYVLQEKYVNGEGEKIRAMAYVADFEYVDTITGLLTVEDVKGYNKDKVYLLKKKLFEKVYYPLTIIEV